MIGKALIICGPTATGKTKLALTMAKKFGGEIISADSRQIYRGMDIITGKDLNQFSNFQIFKFSNNKTIGYYSIKEVPVWLYDIVSPDHRFSVADYINDAREAIHNIRERGKLPIIVGGTGFYIKGLIEGISTMGVEPDWGLREKLSNYPITELSNLLKKIDPGKWGKMNESDRKNPRRLIRAIEIIENSSKIRKLPRNAGSTFGGKIENLLMIGLAAPYKFLYRRIDKRVDDRIAAGAEEEIINLLKKGYNWENSVMGVTIGYQEWQPYFEKKESKESVIQRWKFAEHNYARRQMTWFRKVFKDSRSYWFDVTSKNWRKEVENQVTRWYY